MIHVGADVHVRDSASNAKDADGQVLVRGRCGYTLPELTGFLAPLDARASDLAGGGTLKDELADTAADEHQLEEAFETDEARHAAHRLLTMFDGN
ncbi:MAG: DUF397 domain-containing protein [Planctomycetota bacterium]